MGSDYYGYGTRTINDINALHFLSAAGAKFRTAVVMPCSVHGVLRAACGCTSSETRVCWHAPKNNNSPTPTIIVAVAVNFPYTIVKLIKSQEGLSPI